MRLLIALLFLSAVSSAQQATELSNKLKTGGNITLTGAYNLDSDCCFNGENETVIVVPKNTTVDASAATFRAKIPFCFRLTDGVKWKGGKITKGRIDIRGSNITVDAVEVDSSWSHSFHIDAGWCKKDDSVDINKSMKNIRITNCVSFRSERQGFAVAIGDYPILPDNAYVLGHFSNITFKNCLVVEPSYKDGKTLFSIYDFCFGVERVVAAENITWANCRAVRAPSAGWHFEFSTPYQNIQLNNCVADSNGVAKKGYPFGYLLFDNISLNNCSGKGNVGGLVSDCKNISKVSL